MKFPAAALALGFAIATTAIITPASADDLAGTWTGGGHAQAVSGKAERVKCRVSYTREGDSTYGFNAVCASPSYKINQSGSLTAAGSNRYIGDFYNADFDIGGRIRVNVSGSTQTVTLSSDRGSGTLQLSR